MLVHGIFQLFYILLLLLCVMWIRIQFMRFLCYFFSFTLVVCVYVCVILSAFGLVNANDITKSLSFAACIRFSDMYARYFYTEFGPSIVFFYFLFVASTHAQNNSLKNACLMRFCGRFCFQKFIII